MKEIFKKFILSLSLLSFLGCAGGPLVNTILSTALGDEFTITILSPSASATFQTSFTLLGTCVNLEGETLTITGNIENPPQTVTCTDGGYSISITLEGGDETKVLQIDHSSLDEPISISLEKKFCSEESLADTQNFAGGSGIESIVRSYRR